MKNRATTAISGMVLFVAGLSIGATQARRGPGAEYDRACVNSQSEIQLALKFAADDEPARASAAIARHEHWVKIMEQFKP
jgi:hypothetical protein